MSEPFYVLRHSGNAHSLLVYLRILAWIHGWNTTLADLAVERNG